MAANDAVVIQMEGLTHHYGDVVAVQDLTLEVQHGEIFGFLGPNGAGKTTTIRTLLDFIRPTAGSAMILGMDVRVDSVAIHQRIGYLPSELKLWDNWTGEQYIRWLERVREQTLMNEAQSLAEQLDYDLARSLKGLSTGMRRKMGLIVALVHKPELLILDEPTTGLDPLMQNVFHEMMRMARQEGRTVFLSSHNLPEVEAICDRVGIIREGKLEAVESVERLTHVTFRWMTLTMDMPSTAGFETISGISDIAVVGNAVRMRVSGEANMDVIIKAAAQHTIRDIRLEQPTLEEIFLAYYGKGSA